MLKRSTTKRNKISAQSPVNPLSNRNNCGNESFNTSAISHQYSSPGEYTIDLKTNLKPPVKLSVKKTPEVQISIGVSKENIEDPRIQNENSPLSLGAKKVLNRTKPISPSNSFYHEAKPAKGIDKSMRKDEYEEDFEITKKMMKLQNELNKLGLFEPRSPNSAASQTQNIKFSSFVEIVNQLREVINKLQLRDTVQKQEINKLRKNNLLLKDELAKIEQKLKVQEKLRDTSLLSPKLENRLINSKRNYNESKLRLEEKAHTFAKSVLSSPSHKTFDLFEQKGKILEAEMSTERPFQDDKANNSSHFNSISANNESLLLKNHFTSLSTSQMPQDRRESQIFFSSSPAPEIKTKDSDYKEATEIDSLVQLRTVTMSDIENLGGGTSSSSQPISNNNLSAHDSNTMKDIKATTLLDPLQSQTRRDGSNSRKASQDPIVPHRLHLAHQKSQGCSSAISFPKTSFVPSKARRDELRIKINDKDLGPRSLSQPRYERQKTSGYLNSNSSPTASKIMNQYKRYLNEPHVSPLQSECKSINMDFGGNYLNNTSKNCDDTRNLSLNNLNSPLGKGSTQTILTDELSKIVIPEEFGPESSKNARTPEEEKVTLFNRCLKLTMGLSSSVLDENQQKRDGDKRTSVPTQNIVLSPNVLNIKKPFGLGVAVRK